MRTLPARMVCRRDGLGSTNMRERTILIPAYDFKPLLGGVANYAHELAVLFSKRARVHVVSRKLPGMEDFDQNLPYTITRIRTPHSALISIPLFARPLRPLIRAHPPDAAVLSHVAARRSGGWWALGNAPIPYFVAAHGTEVFDNFASMQNQVRTVLTRKLKRNVFQRMPRRSFRSATTRGGRCSRKGGAMPAKSSR